VRDEKWEARISELQHRVAADGVEIIDQIREAIKRGEAIDALAARGSARRKP
jgi:hypothetical protein